MRRRSGARIGGALTLIVLLLGSLVGSVSAARVDRVVFTISSPQITESSALAVSTTRRGLVYTINDSGDGPYVYVLDSSNGDLVGTTTLAGVEARDVEAIATGEDGNLVVADIGDNKNDHESSTLYLIPQPGRGNHTVTPQAVTVTYDNGPRDAESVLYVAATGRVYVVSKQFNGAKVYRSPPRVFERQSAVLTPVAPATSLATDATFLPGGDVAVIRNYFGAVAYRFPSWKRITDISLPAQRQGESVTAPRRGNEIWIGTEGANSKVLAVPLPDLAPKKPKPSTTAPSTAPTTGASSAGDDQLEQAAKVVVVGAGAALVVLVILGAWLYRRHQPDD